MKGILKYHSYIFDFDGVIVDSVNIKTKAFAEIYRPYGEEVASKVISHHLSHGGINRFEKFRYYHKNFLKKPISDGEVSALAKRFSEVVLRATVSANSIKGALDFLKLLKRKGKQMFIISATPEEEIKKIISMRKLKEFFVDIKGAPTKKKDNLVSIVENYQLKLSECLYFGDSKEDLEAASFLAVDFIPINYFDGKKGYKDFKELLKAYKIV